MIYFKNYNLPGDITVDCSFSHISLVTGGVINSEAILCAYYVLNSNFKGKFGGVKL